MLWATGRVDEAVGYQRRSLAAYDAFFAEHASGFEATAGNRAAAGDAYGKGIVAIEPMAVADPASWLKQRLASRLKQRLAELQPSPPRHRQNYGGQAASR